MELSGAANLASIILAYPRLIIKLIFRPTLGVRFSDWLCVTSLAPDRIIKRLLRMHIINRNERLRSPPPIFSGKGRLSPQISMTWVQWLRGHLCVQPPFHSTSQANIQDHQRGTFSGSDSVSIEDYLLLFENGFSGGDLRITVLSSAARDMITRYQFATHPWSAAANG